MQRENPREIAVRVLSRRESGEYVEQLLEQELAASGLSQADRRLCQELVCGVVRWQATLDWLIARKTHGRTQKRLLRDLLRLGLYQIFWLERIPDHAAVHQTVELARQSGFGPQAGFVNALLRGYLREASATRGLLQGLKTDHPNLGYSHPEWLVDRWSTRWGPARAAALMDWNNTPPKIFARVNTLKTDAGRLIEQWRDENVEYDFVRRDWFDENLVFELKAHPPLHRLGSFRQGLFYVQDPSTLLAVRRLDPRPGEAVLDLCAAPGGKLTYMAQLMRNEGQLVAHDTAPERIQLIVENCARLGVTCVEMLSPGVSASPELPNVPGPSPGQRTHSSPPLSKALPLQAGSKPTHTVRLAQFDRVLVDAPCSNTGVMRRRVDLRWRLRPEEIERLHRTQSALLSTAASRLKTGGVIVYSTCSLEPEENEAVVNEFLRKEPGFALQCHRELLPFVDEVDGAYVACLQRGR